LVDRTEQGKRAQPVVGDGSSAGVGEASGAEDEEGPVLIGADLLSTCGVTPVAL